jgi:hypothetical protein
VGVSFVVDFREGQTHPFPFHIAGGVGKMSDALRDALEVALDTLRMGILRLPDDQLVLRQSFSNAADFVSNAISRANSSDVSVACVRIDAAVTRCYRRFKEWSNRNFSADDVTWCEVRADLVEIAQAMLSASPQAAKVKDNGKK